MKHLKFSILSIVILFASCKKDEVFQYNSNLKGSLTVEFDNIAGAADLQLNTGLYTNASGETFKVTKLKYYVSNFVLTTSDNTIVKVPQDSCYFLIDESNAASHKPALTVPEGEYKTLTFMVGVDSIRSTQDISQRIGVLDPTTAGGDMYWGWNSGYIFLKLEGSLSSSAKNFMYHIGGFGGYSSTTINNLKTIKLDLLTRGVAQVKAGKGSNIHLMVDILKIFNGSSNISIATNSMVMFNAFSANIANNYTAMFRHDHTDN